MRFITRVTLNNEAGNRLCTDREMGQKMEAIMAEVRPEHVYFCIENGQRTLYCVVNVEGSHELPRIAEPLWLGLQANVEFIPAMNKEEFAKAAKHVENAAKKFNWS